MRKYLFYILLVLCGALVSCNKSAEGTAPPRTLSFTASIGGYQSKATDTVFEQGDRIGLYCWDGLYLDNQCLTAEGGELLPDNPIEIADNPEKGVTFKAYYPYDPSFDGYAERMVEPDQSIHEYYTYSDFIIGEGKALLQESDNVELYFHHALSNIVIIPECFEEIAELYLTDVLGKYSYSIYDNYVYAFGYTGTVKTGKISFQGMDAWTAVVPPQQTSPRLLIVTVSGAQYEYDLSYAIWMEAGARTVAHVEITEDSATAEISQELQAWADDPWGTFDRVDMKESLWVAGPATGYADMIPDELEMTPCFNDYTSCYRDGLFEKFIVLEANEDFYIFSSIDGQPYYIGAELEIAQTEAYELYGDVVYRGEALYGESIIPMTVPQTGLYHVVLDVNRYGDLRNPMVMVAYAGDLVLRGDFNRWDTTLFEHGEFFNHVTTFSLEGIEMRKGQGFKFAYGHSWVIDLDDSGNVGIPTSFGNGSIHPGENITVPGSGIYNITVFYDLSAGNPENSFIYEVRLVGGLDLDPSTFVVGLSGVVNGWADPSGNTLAYYDSESSEFNADGSAFYIFKIDSIDLPEGGFKVRVDGRWIGVGECWMSGTDYYADDDNNFYCIAPGTYKVSFTIYWDGNDISDISVIFKQM